MIYVVAIQAKIILSNIFYYKSPCQGKHFYLPTAGLFANINLKLTYTNYIGERENDN